MWVFGYGSLIWKPGFAYVRWEVGHVKGYERRFWWKSFHHRGTRENPGRVLILRHAAQEGAKMWGVAYEVEDREWEGKVREQLAEREMSGMVEGTACFYPVDGEVGEQTVMVCVGSQDHEQWAGPEGGDGGDVGEEAEIIARAEGVSGSNKEYLYKLWENLEMIHPQGEKDEYIEELVNKVRAIENISKIA